MKKKFNTAVFYDIENLTKGYDISSSVMSNLSLKDIVGEIKNDENVEEVAVHRAYANWSDSRLNFLRGDILDLGIEPVQIFGFSKGMKKNAADIALTVDAIDLANTRPSIDTFVIISGDGGFSYLAKKLHEYGRIVIGGSYESTRNDIFRSVCDAFITIPDPDYLEKDYIEDSQSSGITDVKAQKCIAKVARVQSENRQTVMNKVHEVLDWFANEYERDIKYEGINITPIRQALNYLIEDFNPIRFGFSKFTKFLQYVCRERPLCVYASHPLVVIGFRNHPIQGFEKLPDISNIHSEEYYLKVLAIDHPIFRPPPFHVIRNMSILLMRYPPKDESLGDLISKLSNRTLIADHQAIKLFLLTCVSANCFERRPEGRQLSEQTLTIRKDFSSSHEIVDNIKTEMRKKIESLIGKCDSQVFENALQWRNGN